MRCRRFFEMFAIASLLAFSVAENVRAEDFQVIVHPSNPASALSADFVSRLMLKKSTTWKHGEAAIPVDLSIRSQTRTAFTNKVLGKSAKGIKAYWRQQIFSGRGVPPAELASDEAVVAFVGRTPGAIGYVTRGASLKGVKAVALRD